MPRGKSRRSHRQARWGRDRLVAIWVAGLLGAFAAGLYWFAPPAAPPDPETTAADARSQRLPAEISVSGSKPAAKRLASPPSKFEPLYARLLALEQGGAVPVTILHLGDSHIAADRITGEVRRLLQARFGDAGRGLMMPGFPFRYYQAPGFSFDQTGAWSVANALRDDGIYGITGVSLTADAPDATLTLTSTAGPFAAAEVSLLAGPGRGRAAIVAGTLRKEVASAADEASVLRVRLPVEASQLKIEVLGDGPVTVLGWSTEASGGGVRYVNLGIPGATVLTTRRFDEALAASDIAALAPKLVILGYGTNEGFNDDLDLRVYEQEYERLLALVKEAAPDAAILVLGPFDSSRLPRFVTGEARAAVPCRPLEPDETADYGALLAREDSALARWHAPPKLDQVRALLARVADRHGAAYWDLKRVMGGACSIHDWANSSPPLALSDHVHLSDEGSRRMGRVMYETLMAGYDRYRQQVDLGSQFAATGAKTSETSGTILKGAP